ncbi:ABC transporter ATP-binding protein [Halobacillus karajensis]|uniref:ABC transporter ATP-binding protein n=1 Tax=Halobacillus karajensis TaxID=195088 RepID=A0A059NZ55_9BACI|nr:ABC transporter ATP-binding protein [Halobacillus karajensis]CDQ18631.1 putative ABC transporter ATP-binding protein [Halobacillus karajensis]CDQ23297.1 putative ABC transporter ATP-binding protein [Halobacillus karajensis]CDQ26779.1 putative ABC transporter ATP-binding protein [Halobacillus karajensis]
MKGKNQPKIGHHHAIGANPPKIDNIGGTLLRIRRYMTEQKITFTLVMVAILISSSLSLLGPYLLGLTVDLVIESYQLETLMGMIGVLFAVYLFHSIFLWLQNYWMIGIAQHAVQFMRSHLFSHMQLLPVPFFQKTPQGELMSRLTNDIENVSRTLNTAVVQFFTSLLTIIGTVVIMLWLSPVLTLLTLTIVPIMYFGMKWITRRTGPYFKKQQRDLGEMNGYVEEMFSGQLIIKMFSKEEDVIHEFEGKNKDLRQSGYYAQVYTGFIPKLMNMLNNASFAIIVGAGGLLALNGFVSIGGIVTFTTYSRQFTRPLNDLANQFNMILSAVAGAERVFQVIDEKEEQEDDQSAKAVDGIRGEITFENVDFSYEEEQTTLSNIHFTVEAGQTVALVGPTGAGKTTIISLLSRFYDPDSGRILMDGIDMKEISRDNLRSQMGVVLQDATMFNTTIRENIRYGRLDASDADVEKAAKSARAHDFITRLPGGYDTVLDSDGKGVSHGQRQLLSIARAMIADPSFLILDEATSSIDTVTEMKINAGLAELMKGRTSFVIAHRLHTIGSADLILVMQDGKIIEKGNHRSLMEKEGQYASLILAQSTDNTG